MNWQAVVVSLRKSAEQDFDKASKWVDREGADSKIANRQLVYANIALTLANALEAGLDK